MDPLHTFAPSKLEGLTLKRCHFGGFAVYGPTVVINAQPLAVFSTAEEALAWIRENIATESLSSQEQGASKNANPPNPPLSKRPPHFCGRTRGTHPPPSGAHPCNSSKLP